MEGNDIEISIDLDISHLALGPILNIENGFEIGQPSKLVPLHGRAEGMDTSTAAGSGHVIDTLFSQIASSMADKAKETDLNHVAQVLGRKKSMNSLLLPREIKEMQISNQHEILPGISLPSQSLPQPEVLSKSTLSAKGLSDFLLEKSGQALSAKSDTKVSDSFNSRRTEILASNFSTFVSFGATGAEGAGSKNWNLSMASVLNTHGKDRQEKQLFSPSVPGETWSAEEIGAVSIIALMVPFILCSNLLVILSIVRFRRLHIPTNYFVTSLASVDVLVALATPFMIMVEVFQFGAPVGGGSGDGGGAFLCLLPNRILMMACGVSLLTLATIAYDRHTALVSPLDYVVIMTSRRVAVLVSLTWAYSALIVWLPLLAGWHDEPTELGQCSADLLHGKAQALFLSAIFLPSCVVILACYARIFSLAHHHAQAIAAVEFAVHRRLQVKFMIKDTKYAKTLALVIGVFLALWLPYLVSVFVKLVAGVTLNIWVQTYLVLVAVLNSGINPWIYAFKNKEFRHAFRRLYHELFRERTCLRQFGRRMSLAHTSGFSTTPRLSRTDSRMATAVVDSATLDNVCEKLQRSLDSLDRFDRFHDRRLGGQCRPWRSGPLPRPYRALHSVRKIKRAHRQAVSCSDLQDIEGCGSLEEVVAILPRSLSVELPSSGTDISTSCPKLDNTSDDYKDRQSDLQLPETEDNSTGVPIRVDMSCPTCCDTHPQNSPFFFSSNPTSIVLPNSPLLTPSLSANSENPILTEHVLSPQPNSLNVVNIEDISASDLTMPCQLLANAFVSTGTRNSPIYRDTFCCINELPTSVLSTASDGPSCPDLSNVPFNAPSTRMSTEPFICSNGEEQTLRQFTSMNGCRDFYPEPRTLTCTVELRVP